MSSQKKEKKERVDKLLVERGLAASIKEAQALIYIGKIFTKDRKILNPSEKLGENAFLGTKESSKSSFASRGGDKLLSAIKELGLEETFKNKTVLDIGASTGGFTDCVLSFGAKEVLALDVGTNQLSWELRQDERVTSIEKTSIKEFRKSLNIFIVVIYLFYFFCFF